jgi:serine/threonine protein kinase/tetratricopeptide (TPR) repeat protein
MVAGVLSGEDLAKAQSHIETCAECRMLFADTEPARTAPYTDGLARQPGAGDLASRRGADRAAAAAARVDGGPTAVLPTARADAGPARSSKPPDADPVGRMLGRYRIATCLGRGGMGEVFLAEDLMLRRDVAIKRIRLGFERDHTFRARLRREAQLAARLNHRAIVQVFDLFAEGGVDHLVMEYVPGPSLHTLVAGSRMPVAEVVRIAAEIADGLAYAHQQGVIHRDLKIENILIGTDRQPKIADFGIARSIGQAPDGAPEESLTREGAAIGTSRAMSPEQISGLDIDGRSDLFSLGVLLYELVTGTSPFRGANDAITMLRVLRDQPRPVRELVPDVPRSLSDLIEQLLEKTRARRPDGAPEVRERLRALDGSAQPRPAPVEPAPRAPLPTPRPPERVPGAPRPTPRPAANTPAPTTTGERRQVTLVCIELVAGGGADGDALADPELLADVLPTFRARIDEILAQFDGLLISALGHRFVACFGHPRPIEDAARRAALAGRALCDAAAGLRAVDPVHTGARFTATAAVHTGLAVMHGRATAEELVLGGTLDTALRLLELGGAGDLWLSGSAARLLEAELVLEPAVRLRDGVTAARRCVGLRVATSPGSGEDDRPMVAREHEMQLLLTAWRRARQGQGQAALLVGEPGIGKSRLARELARTVAGDRPREIALRGSGYRQRSALEPVAEAITALFGRGIDVGASSDPAGDIAAVAERIRSLTGPEEAEHVLRFLGHAADPPAVSPERARLQLLGGLRDVLVGASHELPTLLVVEDLHWLDPSTLDLIALILQDLASLRLFLVMTTRPGLQPPWPAVTAVTQLQLGRLEAAAIDAVIGQACGNRPLATADRALIASRSEGVPLYAEALVRAALELGGVADVPSTLRDALTARLHQLGPSATWIARIAAVAGREFTASLIATAGGLDRAAVEHELDRLVDIEILLRRRGRNILYQFSHVLLQQAAYDELLVADRRQLHGEVANVLLADERAGHDPGPELIAHHLVGARRFEEAIASAQSAALRALGRHARVEARELLRQALAWLDQLPASDARDRSEIGLRMQLGAVLISTEGYTSSELEGLFRRAEILCERHQDMPLPVKYGLWAVRLMRGSLAEVEPLVGWFEHVIDREPPPIERMMAHASIGTYAYARADYVRSSHHFERAMALFAPAEHAGVVQTYGGCGGFYGHIISTFLLWRIGRFAGAWRHARETVEQAEALDPYSLVCALSWQMSLYIAAEDVARAEANAERFHELSVRHEFPYPALWARCGLGWALARRGQAERAIAELVAGTEGIRQIGIRVYFPYLLSLLADSAITLGRLDLAERALDEALEVCRTSVDCSEEPELLRLRGRLILGRDASAHAAAQAAFADSLAVAQRQGALASALRAATDLAALLRADHRSDEAMAVLAPMYRRFASELDDPNLAAARQLMTELPSV